MSAILQIRTTGAKRFFRAGFCFGKTITELKIDELTPKQIAALKSEPNLVVAKKTDVTVRSESKGKSETAKAGKEKQ